jgi:hypothetical protein
MTAPCLTEPSETTLTQDLLYAARYYLGGRRGPLILAAVAVIAGLALNWSWLVAAGIAPILLGVLPCLAMCALGLCMHRAGGKSCSAKPGNAEASQTAVTPDTPPLPRLIDNGPGAVRALSKRPDQD